MRVWPSVSPIPASYGAYRRSDALKKRRALMTAWDQHCGRKDSENVVRLQKA